ncbi:short-chain dehydrogenase [Diaporthe amygdali]|uniref:short-chain dehydrogenase n=1 Tax=Phomopsis amygdali TaxID=1214568 RepID=UPI0022FED77C|nr:short-chain dehydrogenase [Diaporthe amygdali]KAJ0119711.1 short-chain dehydrogenase [Diaporthe amygdali]
MPPPQGTPNVLEGPGDYTVTKSVHSDTYPAIDPSKLSPSLLKDRAVFISGASRGIGKAIATSFARGGASQIAIGARSSSSLAPVAEELRAAAREAGRDAEALRVLCVEVEVSSPESVAAAAALVAREFGGRLDIVVQNAAVLGSMAKIADADPDEWWRVYAVNVRGQFLVAKYFLPLMLGTAGGLRTFVTVASVGAHVVGPGFSHYQSGKLANLRVAEFVDKEYAEEGVSAWTVHPGNVVTDMVGGPDGYIMKEMGHIFVDTPQISADTIVYLTATKRQWLSGRRAKTSLHEDFDELLGLLTVDF